MNIKSLIQEHVFTYLHEMDDEERKDFELDKNEPEVPDVDADIEGKPYDDDTIYHGSDIAGIKQGGTGMPHGHGYPNAPKRKRKFDREHIQKTIRIDSIYGVSEEDENEFGKMAQNSTYRYIQKHFPWIFTFSFKEEYSDKMYYPFADYFSEKFVGAGWLDSFYAAVRRNLSDFKHWMEFPKEKMRGQAKQNPHWILRYKNARVMNKQYPTLEQDFNQLLGFLDDVSKHSLTDPNNKNNYPLYVSLYDVTRRLGGHEEGGWWYDRNDLLKTVKVNSPKDARKAAIALYHIIENADLNGKALIILEKTKNSLDGPPPTYS